MSEGPGLCWLVLCFVWGFVLCLFFLSSLFYAHSGFQESMDSSGATLGNAKGLLIWTRAEERRGRNRGEGRRRQRERLNSKFRIYQ